MIITFANQKGGAGKTTLAVAFSNYISMHSDRTVKVFDFDFQRSFYNKWKDDEISPLPQLYTVDYVDPEVPFEGIEYIFQMLESDDIHIFDLAGTLDEKYQDLLNYSNFIIVPYEYSNFSVRSTMEFISLLQSIESESQRIFIASRYDKGYNYLNQPTVDEQLAKYGLLLNDPIYRRNSFQTISTRALTRDQKEVVSTPFNQIITLINETLKTTI